MIMDCDMCVLDCGVDDAMNDNLMQKLEDCAMLEFARP
jgi:hypothetical protein